MDEDFVMDMSDISSPASDRAARPQPAANRASIGHDLRMADAVECALQASAYRPLRALHATASGGTVVIRGKVPSFYLKQVAQAVAMAVASDRPVRNDLEVVGGD